MSEVLAPTLEISFGRSPSPSFADAVRLASELPGYRKSGSGRDERHGIELAVPVDHPERWSSIQDLYTLVGSWKRTRLRLGGAPLAILWELDQEVTMLQACFALREQLGGHDDHCRGQAAPSEEPRFFGCRFEQGVRLGDGGHGETPVWYQFGTLAPDRETFRVDAERILERLEGATRGALCTHCPAFDWARLESGVRELHHLMP